MWAWAVEMTEKNVSAVSGGLGEGRMCPGSQGAGWTKAAWMGTHQSTVPKATDASGPQTSSSQPASEVGSSRRGLRLGASSVWGSDSTSRLFSPGPCPALGPDQWLAREAHFREAQLSASSCLSRGPDHCLKLLCTSETSGVKNFTPKEPK